MWPANISQVGYPGAGDIDDCWVIATIWAAAASTPGVRKPTVTEFRRYAGDPDDGISDGGSLTEIMDGIHGCWPGLSKSVLRYESSSWDILARLIRSGRPASVALDSGKLPAVHRYGFMGKHQVGVAWEHGNFLIANPLAPDGSPPKAITEASLKYAMSQLLPSLKVFRAAVFPAPEIHDVPGLTTTPGTSLITGTARLTKGTEVIRVADRERIDLPQDATRPAVGPFVSDDLGLPGYFVNVSGSTCWVRRTQANFTPAASGLPATIKTDITIDGVPYIGNATRA